MNLRKLILTASIACTACVMLSAQEDNPLWMRYPAISPSGQEIVFSYQGDLFCVATEGGTARRLTTSEGRDYRPMWSPDGSQIAFVSDRSTGRSDIYVMDARGGQAQRVTTHSTSENPIAWTRDGKYILYGAHIQAPASSALFPSRYSELYRIPAEGGRTEQLMATPVAAGALLPDGSGIIYEDIKGMENAWRKHHTSAVTRDIIRYDFKSQKYTPIVTWEGEDRNPVLSTDGKRLYFLSERDKSCFNVFSCDLDGKEVKQLTHYSDHPVRFLTRSDDGTLCYGYDGEIYTLKEGDQPQRVQVRVISDYREEPLTEISLRSGITSMDVSPDGKQVAFVIRGEVFVTSADYRTTKRITDTPAAESSVTFADDRTLVYSSQRNGKSDLYIATIKRSEDPDFPHATLIDEKLLIPGDKSEKTCPQFAPNGKDIAYLKDRSKLVIYNIDTKREHQVTDGRYQLERDGNIDFTWSPDSKWIAMSIVDNGHNPYCDVAIVSTTESNPEIHNLTQSGYFDMSPRFVMDGNAIIYTSEQYGMRNHASWGSMNDVMIVFLNREAYDKFVLNEEDYELLTEAEKKAKEEAKKKEKKKDDKKKDDEAKEDQKDIVVELENIDRRVMRLTPVSSDLGDAFISNDGETLYYMSAFEGGYDLWKKDLRKGDVSLMKKLDGSYYTFLPTKDGKEVFMFGSRDIKKMSVPSGKIEGVSFDARMKLRPSEERAFEFDYVRREASERIFYEDITNINGTNWPEMVKHYEKFLPYITNDYDFSEMLSELLGELNVSHSGSGYYGPVSGPATAELGLFLDWTPSDKGLMIDEIVIGGPFDNYQSKVKVGDYITAIDGEEIKADTDVFPLLSGKAGRETLITLYSPATGKHWGETIKPITSGKLRGLLYDRWVKQRADEVKELSGGKLGYVHIPSMDDESFRTVYSEALGKYYDCDGIVIDVRYNGGGRLHEDIEVLFTGTKYLEQMTKGDKYCPMPSRRWNKPSVMVTCEYDYSNAHGTPWVYQTMKIGKVVGMPVAGTMSSVNWITLQNPALYFGVPVIGYMTKDGYYLENHQLEPDVRQPLDFNAAMEGHDTQLKRAVEVLSADLK